MSSGAADIQMRWQVLYLGDGLMLSSMTALWVVHGCILPSSHVRNSANFNFNFKTKFQFYFGMDFKYKMLLKH
jgi:hypothetical protein